MELQIKRIQKEKGINNLELAKRLGVSSQYAGALANGKVGASIDKYEAVAEALGVKLWQLFAPLADYMPAAQPAAKPITENNQEAQPTDGPDMILVDRATGATHRYKLMS